ncbi:DUF6174 domain-containing protein [Teredinibacter sp. KSP-S5-2]|uniref:DUF6174 domain-containing protein n=1 Tax=Teredinibacter sp. KSP-S5-2 TaxID=3034506 RepID=UPI002934B33D|nr:DUF6174 domain-containing protein [Teredinibacter sp. KSP-S5-2]WNO11175.1 DUF6174 domain-containing protein [Teredinibacter sp. KSP-S5-2]
MNDLKHYFSSISIGVVGVVFVYVFYGFYLQLEIENRKARIDERLGVWLKNEPNAYSYVVHEGCMLFRSYQVIHKNGEDLFFDMKLYCDPEESPGCDAGKRNILGIFEEIKRISESAEMLDVTYSDIGYPSEVDIDWRRDTIDDECFIAVEDFREI